MFKVNNKDTRTTSIMMRIIDMMMTNVGSSEAATRGVLKIIPKFTGKYLCQSSFFDKVAGLRLIMV